jgi:HPt (histidine-containing phosphotransfer) domain-containing protein
VIDTRSEEPHVDAYVIAELRELGEGLLQQMIRSFLHKTPGRLGELAGALERGDAAQLRLGAHGLRGSAGSIGAKRLATLTTALEFRAAAQPMGDVVAAVNAIREELAHVTVALEGVLAEAP